MATLEDMENTLERAITVLRDRFGTVITAVGIAVGEELVPATPVITGFARANSAA